MIWKQEAEKRLDTEMTILSRLQTILMTKCLCSPEQAHDVLWALEEELERFGRGRYWKGREDECRARDRERASA